MANEMLDFTKDINGPLTCEQIMNSDAMRSMREVFKYKFKESQQINIILASQTIKEGR